METVTANQFASAPAPLPERPQFLSVLCILTWVACGIIFLQVIAGLVMRPEKQAGAQTETRAEASANTGKIEISDGEHMFNSVLNLIGGAFGAFGALWMWRLKRTGFFIYLIGEIVTYIIYLKGNTLAALSSSFGSMGDTFIGAFIGIMVVSDIAFIVMYALNLKHMKK